MKISRPVQAAIVSFLCKYWNENLNVWRRWMDILFDPLSWKYAEQCWLWGEKRKVNLSKIWHYMYAETTLDPTYCWKRAMPHIHQWTDGWWAKHQVLLNTLRYFWYFEVLWYTFRYFNYMLRETGNKNPFFFFSRFSWISYVCAMSFGPFSKKNAEFKYPSLAIFAAPVAKFSTNSELLAVLSCFFYISIDLQFSCLAIASTKLVSLL